MVDILRRFVEERTRSDQFSGALLLSKGGRPIFEYASGLANREGGVLNTLKTKFNLGSANKMFTGVAIAQLIERKVLAFDIKVGQILPDYPNQAVREQVTVHHLLTHTSGLGSFIDIQFRSELLAARKNLTTVQSVIDLFKNRPLPFPVGELHYSSDGYELLGAIIETVSGLSYYNYVKRHIYEISNMPNTDSFEIDPENIRADIAVGYTYRDPLTDRPFLGKRVDNLGVNLFKGTAGGSGYSTCYDLFNFCQSLLGNKLISFEMTNLVLSPKINEGSKGNQTKYEGYGFQVFDIGGVKRVGHPGRFAGVNTRIDMYPDLGYTVIVLSNYDFPAAFDIAEKAGELIIGK